MDFMSLFTYQNVAIAILVFCVVWMIWLKPYIQRQKDAGNIQLTDEQIAYINSVVHNSAIFANEMFKSETVEERKKLALDFAFKELENSNVLPKEYINIIRIIVEEKLNKIM
jgi:hypothetical protein